MKHRTYFMAAAVLCIAAICSCSKTGKTLETKTYSHLDSASRADLSVEVELPVSQKGAAAEIRKGLIDIMDGQLAFIASYEGDRRFARYDGDASSDEAIVDYYRKNALDSLNADMEASFQDFKGYIMADPEISDEEKASIIENHPRGEYDFKLTKEYETDRLVVFTSVDYIFLGGAHGGVAGQGSVTFDKRDGHRVNDFLLPDAAARMQDLLLKGLTEYFSDSEGSITTENVREYLFIDGDSIPLPVWAPSPAETGLCFTYQQYEIAAYAMGMPSFIVPYEEIKPYLTAEAADLLNLK